MPVPGEENLTSDASYGLLGWRPESIESVLLATRDAMRAFGQDHVLSFIGKKAVRPVTAWDSACERAAIVMAMYGGIMYRGVKPSGYDKQAFDGDVDRTEKWLRRIADPNDSVEPYFVDSTPTLDEMGSLSGSTRLSDARMRGRSAYPRRACGCR
jgi:hypothetical protein